MEVHVYKGDFNIPSLDLDCLRILTYIKLTEAKVDVIQCCNPHKSPTGILPYLVDKITDSKIVGYTNIVKFLKKNGYDINKNLSNSRFGIASGLTIDLHHHLNPAFQYILWGQPLNVNETRLFYSRQIPFPFNFYYPRKYIENARDTLMVLSDLDIEDLITETESDEIIYDAKRFINFLSKLLEKNLWFMNSKLCSEIDVTIYAYLTILYNLKLPKNPLDSHIRECPNLVQFIERISKKCFSEEIYLTKTKPGDKKSTESTSTGGKDEEENGNKIQILAGIGAVLAMVGYAVASGILSISRDSNSSSQFDYDEIDDDDDYN